MEISTTTGYRPATDMPFTLLLIEQPLNAADYLSLLLGQFNPVPIDWIHVTSVGQALARLSMSGVHGVLLDVTVSDGPVHKMIAQIGAAAPEIPIVVLADEWDAPLMKQVLLAGAQDYLVKGQTDASLLVRALSIAVERKQGDPAREDLIQHLRRALPIGELAWGVEHMCMFCKKFRDGHGQWVALEGYLQDQVGMNISHGMCLDCSQNQYPEFTEATRS